MKGEEELKGLVHRIKTLIRRSSLTKRQQPQRRTGSSVPSPNLQTLHTTPSSRLECLPAELRCQILSSFSNLDDLKSTAHASPVLYQQYRADRKIILDSVLRQTLGDKVFVDAYAVQKSLPLEGPAELPVNLGVQFFMMEYQKHYSGPSLISSECTVEDLIGMAAFYTSTIKPLLVSIPAMLLRNLNRSLQLGSLSSTERTRITRALYRFQMWCNLYGTSDIAAARDWPLDPFDMLMYFFEIFHPWEIEEISCIHTFFMEMYDRIFVDIRWDLDSSSIRFLDSAGNSSLGGPVDLSWGDDDGDHRKELQNGVVSRGLEFHLKIMRTDDHEELVKTLHPVLKVGLNSIDDILDRRVTMMRRTLNPSDRDKAERDRQRMMFRRDHADKPPAAWVILWRGRYSNYYGERIPVSLKRWGYVFWNCGRLSKSRGKKVVKRTWPSGRRGRG